MSELKVGADEKEEKKPRAKKEAPGVPVDIEKVVKELAEKVEKLQEENIILLKTADRGRLENEKSKRKKQPTPIVGVSTWKGKLLVAWRTFTDEVYRDSDNGWHEKQLFEIVFEDGTKEIVPLIDFFRGRIKIDAEVIKRKVLNEDDLDVDVPVKIENFKLKILDNFKDERTRAPFKDLIGREVTLGGEFVN